MSVLRMTPEQLQAHQDRVHGRRTQPTSESKPAAKVSAPADKYPLALRDQIVSAGLPEPYREHCFHPTRGWRLDLAWPEQRKLAVEVDGQVHRIKGRFQSDMEKHNALVLSGWRYLRVSNDMVRDGRALELVRELLG